MKQRSALILGATGLVGAQILQELLMDPTYSMVRILVRRSTGIKHDKLEECLISFDELEKWVTYFQVDDVFCALGTTIKKAKSQEAFRKVDFDYPFIAGQLAKQMRVKQFLLISSLGANPNSKIFYSRTKGEIEQALIKLSLPSLHIFRPSLLLGDRKETRFGEQFATFITRRLPWVFSGSLRPYAGIESKTVAKAMIQIAKKNQHGVHIYPSIEIHKIGSSVELNQ